MAEKTEKPAKVIKLLDERTTKMRIRLFDPKHGSLISDRLVEQSTEMRMGPKEVHKGPMNLEFNLQTQEDVDQLVEYIQKLKGELPIQAPGEKKPKAKKIDAMLSEKEPLEDLLRQAKAKAKTQEKLIEFLREFNFRFVATDVVLDNAVDHPDQLTLKDNHHGYQWMVRLVKEAKDPANDKYDWRLVFGIKFLGETVEKVQVYLWGKYEKTWTVPWEQPKKINFKRVEKVYSFPEFMDYADRKRWRKENRQRIAAEEKGLPMPEATKFFEKWTPYVKVN